MSFSCYCLTNEQGKTYVGFSTDVNRRLRQHNGELQGGAKATRVGVWKRICLITGFPTHQSALQFEWKWKQVSRKASGKTAVERRCNALIQLLNSEQSTSKAASFSTYENPLLVLVEDETARLFFRDKELMYGIVLE